MNAIRYEVSVVHTNMSDMNDIVSVVHRSSNAMQAATIGQLSTLT